MIKKVINHKDDIDTIIIYLDNVLNDKEIFDYLEKMTDFEGAEKYTPRLQKWYQSDQHYFSKLWKKKYKRWISKDYDKYLLELQKKIEDITNTYIDTYVKFNSCLINKYRDGTDIIKPHRDAIESFGEYPIISNISLGAPRTIRFDSEFSESFELVLKSGSLLIMAGSSQKYFKHSIPVSDNNDIRYSLTFREFIG